MGAPLVIFKAVYRLNIVYLLHITTNLRQLNGKYTTCVYH